MLSRLGFPPIGANRRFVSALLVDAVGSGVFMPISILYFLAATPLSLVQIGLALSIAAATQLPVSPLLGSLVDRVGAKRVLLGANAVEAVGFAGYLFAHSFVGVLLPAVLVYVGVTAFWGSFSPVVVSISKPGERERWFGFLGALRNASFAIGGLLAAVAITIGTSAAYTVVVLANMTSYVLAFVLLLPVKVSRPVRAERPEAHARDGWARVLRDRPYHLFVATNVTYAMSALVLNVAIPVYFTEILGLPGWVVGAVFTLNTVLIGVAQGLAVNAMTGHMRTHLIACGSLLFAASYAVFFGASRLGVGLGAAVVLLGAIVYTGGELVAGPVMSALAAEAAPEHLRGRYISLYQMSWTIAMTIAPVTLTWLLEQGSSWLWGGLAGLSIVGATLTVPLRRVMAQAAAPVTRAEQPSGQDVEAAAVGA